MSYVLINPLQQVLTFAEYKKALEKADAFEKQHTFKAEEQKPKRGRPVGTIKKPKVETEPKKRGRPPKAPAPAEAEAPAPKPVGRPKKEKAEVAPKAVGRPVKLDDYFDFRTAMNFNQDLKGQGWYTQEDKIDEILKDHFKDTKSIRLQNGLFEIYDDKKGWIVRNMRSSTKEERDVGAPKIIKDPDVVVNDTFDDLREFGDVPFEDYLHRPESQFDKKVNKIKSIIKQYLIKRFGM